MGDFSESPFRQESNGSVARWRDIICSDYCLVDLDSRSDRSEFDARLARKSIANATMVRLNTEAQFMGRTHSGIAQDNCSDVQLVYIHHGDGEYRQHGRSCRFKADECFIMDHGHPYDLHTTGRTQNLAVQIPRNWFSRHVTIEDFTANIVDTSSNWGAALTTYLRALYHDFDTTPSISPPLIIEHALLLVELTMGGQPLSGTTHQQGLLRRARSIMRELYEDDELTPAKVAEILGLSKSYMHKLFAEAGTTFCTELDSMRIDRAAAILEARNQRHLTINEIGIRCGLPNPPHFARKFRAHKGVTPTQYRSMMLDEM